MGTKYQQLNLEDRCEIANLHAQWGLDPGKFGALSLDLKPFLYALFCNIPGHFMAGMWTTINLNNSITIQVAARKLQGFCRDWHMRCHVSNQAGMLQLAHWTRFVLIFESEE